MSSNPEKGGATKTEVKEVEVIKEVEKVMDSVQVAKVAHEVNRAYCQAIGDDSQPRWDDAPDWQAKSAILGVEFHRNNPDAGPSASHESWLKEKELDGWIFGPVKNPETKEHPCFVHYSQLPVEQRAKDYIFRAIVHVLLDIPSTEIPGPRPTTPEPSAEATKATPAGDL